MALSYNGVDWHVPFITDASPSLTGDILLSVIEELSLFSDNGLWPLKSTTEKAYFSLLS